MRLREAAPGYESMDARVAEEIVVYGEVSVAAEPIHLVQPNGQKG
jgi:hypothetical protein